MLAPKSSFKFQLPLENIQQRRKNFSHRKMIIVLILFHEI